MNFAKLLKYSLLLTPTLIVLNHDFFKIRRVKGNHLSPIFNPKFDHSTSLLEDDYVLIRVLGDYYDPKDIKNKYVSVIDPDGSTSVKIAKCIEGEWCPSPFGFTFVQSGHTWVDTNEGQGESVRLRQVPLASIEGVVERVIWPPDRFDSYKIDSY